MGHHAYFLLSLLPKISTVLLSLIAWGTSSGQTPYTESLLYAHPHSDHVSEVMGGHAYHPFIVDRRKGIKEHLGQFPFFRRWPNTSCHLPPSLSILFKGLFILLRHCTEFVPVRGQI